MFTKLATSHCTIIECPLKAETTCLCSDKDTHGEVYSHHLSYFDLKSAKRRRLFYGKSGNENHIESL